MTATTETDPIVTRPSDPGRILGLEGLRAIAIAAVFLTHTGYVTGVTGRSDWGAFLGRLEIGPTIFFMISAFLLGLPFAEANQAGARAPSARRFLRRRAVRVFPAYWLTLVLLFVVFGVDVDGFGDVVRLATLTHIYSDDGFFSVSVLVPTWTLATELAFYAFLLGWAAAVRRIGRDRDAAGRLSLELMLVGVLVVIAFAFRALVDAEIGLPAVAEFWLPGQLDIFAVGLGFASIVAYVRVTGNTPRLATLVRRGPDVVVGLAGLAYLGVPLFTNVSRGLVLTNETSLDGHLAHAFYLLCATLLLAPIALRSPARSAYLWFVRLRPVAYFGLVSYGFYLWHDHFIVEVAGWSGGTLVPYPHADFWIVASAAFALSLAAGSISYHVVERPALDLDAGRFAALRARAREASSIVPAVIAGTRTAATNFDLFDGLRAIAALTVVLHHVALPTGRQNNGFWASYLTEFDVGVAIFFLISGFLLYRPFVTRALGDEPEPPLGRFLVRRAVRIYPAYWFALAGILVFVGFQAPVADGLPQYLSYFGLVHVYFRDWAAGGMSQAWTLAVEVTFYLFLPVWAALVRRLGAGRSGVTRVHLQLGALAAMYLFAVAFRAYCYWGAGDDLAFLGVYWLPANLDLFALGMGVAVVSAGAQAGVVSQRVTARLATIGSWSWLGSIGAFVVLCNAFDLPLGIAVRPDGWQGHVKQATFGLVALGLLLPAVFATAGRDPIRRLLAWRPLAYCGVVSYGIYLWHQAWAKKAVGWQAHPLFAADFVTVLAATLALTLLAASVSWFVVERPLMRAVHRKIVARPPMEPVA